MPDTRQLTFTEEARRRQIVDCTIEPVAERGYAGTSLSVIAARARISKAAVLYHFTSKEAVITATAGYVVDEFVRAVGALVDAADGPEGMLLGYLRGATGHLSRHRAHARVLAESMVAAAVAAEPGSPTVTGRWQAVAGILDLGQRDGAFRPFDTRALAPVIGGALDGIVAAWLGDPTFDLDAAASELEAAVLLAVGVPPGGTR